MKKIISIFCLLGFMICSCKSQKDKIQTRIENAQNSGLLHGAVLCIYQGDTLILTANGMSHFSEKLPNTVNTKFYLASLTKLFTQLAILKLSQESRLVLEAPLSQYLKELPETMKGIPIMSLLNMTSGLPRELNENSENSFVFYDGQNRAWPFLRQSFQKENGKFQLEKSGEMVYSNLGYWLLGAVIEEVTDKDLNTAFEDLIFSPLEIDNSGVLIDGQRDIAIAKGYTLNAKGEYRLTKDVQIAGRYASGGAYSTIVDLTAIALSLEDEGFLREEHRRILFNLKEDALEKGVLHHDKNMELYGNLPGYTNFMILDQQEELLIIALNNIGVSDLNRISTLRKELFRDLEIEEGEEKRGRVVKVIPMDQYPTEDPLALGLLEWVKTIEKGNAEEIFDAINRHSLPGEFSPDDEGWYLLSMAKQKMGNFKIAGFQKDQDGMEGYRIWIKGQGEATLSLAWYPFKEHPDKVELLHIEPIDFPYWE